MQSWFRKREYPHDLTNSEMREVTFYSFKIKNNDTHNNMTGIPLIVTYDPYEPFSQTGC